MEMIAVSYIDNCNDELIVFKSVFIVYLSSAVFI